MYISWAVLTTVLVPVIFFGVAVLWNNIFLRWIREEDILTPGFIKEFCRIVGQDLCLIALSLDLVILLLFGTTETQLVPQIAFLSIVHVALFILSAGCWIRFTPQTIAEDVKRETSGWRKFKVCLRGTWYLLVASMSGLLSVATSASLIPV